MQNGIGIIAALAALAIWQFLIWPWIGRATRRAAQGAAEALKPAAADSGLLLAKATAKARGVFDSHFDSYLAYSEADWDRLDGGIRAGVEAQMMVVAESVTLLNLALQDVAYDEGRVDRLKVAAGQNGFPKLKISDDDFRRALRELWSRFSVPTRMNLDMRYRYIFREKLASKPEASMFALMTGYAERTLTNEFSFGAHQDTEWLQFLNDLALGEMDGARRFMAEISA
jgi:hypothetical protein